MINEAYDYDDVSLVPNEISNIDSREYCDTSIYFSTNPINGAIDGYALRIPIFSSPMVDVTDGKMAKLMREAGGFGIIHRFNSIDEQIKEANKVSCSFLTSTFCAVGINGDFKERAAELGKNHHTLLCIDVANGATNSVRKAIEQLLSINERFHFIVGNVASSETYYYCATLPKVIGVRVGIAGGHACTTKDATGIYHPAISLLLSCRRKKDQCGLKPLIIADGGIRGPADFCKAIAAGADAIMLGSILAGCKDSPAKPCPKDNTFNIYRGSASEDIQKLYRDSPKYIEGTTRLVPYNNESVADILNRFKGGLQSSMSYFNARTIFQFQVNANFVVKRR